MAYTLAYLLAVALRRFWAVPLALGAALVVIMGLANSWVLMFALCVVAVSVRPKVAAVVVGGRSPDWPSRRWRPGSSPRRWGTW